MNWYDAQNWLDILDHIWIGLVMIAVAGVPAYFAARSHKAIQTVNAKADTLVGNVQNGHTVPLRADLDRVIAAVDDLTQDVRGLRQDLAMEEDRRRNAVADLYTELDHRTGRHRKQED